MPAQVTPATPLGRQAPRWGPSGSPPQSLPIATLEPRGQALLMCSADSRTPLPPETLHGPHIPAPWPDDLRVTRPQQTRPLWSIPGSGGLICTPVASGRTVCPVGLCQK